MKEIYINLPIANAQRSREFFEKIGFTYFEKYSAADTVCMQYTNNVFFMLMESARFEGFSLSPVPDIRSTTGLLTAIDAGSREGVDHLIEIALAAGATLYAEPVDYGFMYGHSFADLDGHKWEVFWMDRNAEVPKN